MREYKIIEIIDERTLIIDYGINEGAKIDDELIIVEKGDEIFNNDKSLGFIYMPKDNVSVLKAFEKFSICRKKEKTKNVISSLMGYKYSLNLEQKEEDNLKLANGEQMTNRKYETNEGIRVGDIVLRKKI